MKPIRTDLPPEIPYGLERDGCAIYMSVRKHGLSTFGTLKRSLDSLVRMGHRTGFVDGEGDGAGVQTDIPRELWGRKLSQAGLRSSLATHPGFWVGHLFVPRHQDYNEISEAVNDSFRQSGLNLLLETCPAVRPEALGRSALHDPPVFWQLAGYSETLDVEKRLLAVQLQLEERFRIHFASLSTNTVVYKVRGSVEALSRYYPDLKDRNYDTSLVLCHARYSTNTVSTFERAQPFALLGHNGEINTIDRFCVEARQIGVQLPYLASDSQNVDRTLHTLCIEYGLDLFEAIEMIFPPVARQVEEMPSDLRAVYTRLRQTFGPYAQGPAGIIARCRDAAVASVDALGLRPLWYFETEKEHILSSERGAIFFENMLGDARPLAPGEKIGFRIQRGKRIEIFEDSHIKQYVMNTAFQREAPQLARRYWSGEKGSGEELSSSDCGDESGPQKTPATCTAQWSDPQRVCAIDLKLLAAAGWRQEHFIDIRRMVKSSKDLLTSLGFDGPLAALDPNRCNLADYFKEKVAVVTNPAIDRGREMEAFSTGSLVGARPGVGQAPHSDDILLLVRTPLLSGGHPLLGDAEVSRTVAEQVGSLSIEDLLAAFAGRTLCLDLGLQKRESVETALKRLRQTAVQAVQNGIQCLVLDDNQAMYEGRAWLDPLLATAVVDEILRQTGGGPDTLRRRTGLIIRSASVRNLHDIVLLSGLGADAINPYAMLAASVGILEGEAEPDPQEKLERQLCLLRLLTTGLEKVISTVGCHELRGYGRMCSSIGLAPSVALSLHSPNFLGSEQAGVTWKALNADSQARRACLTQNDPPQPLPKTPHFYPAYWKKVSDFARGELDYSAVQASYQGLTETNPVALRHLLGFKASARPLAAGDVDLHIREHNLPLVIGAMSFGSQSELAFRAYAHAASALNIVCINGEGGELPGIIGLYKHNRGQQVASGRFGVNAEFLNSASVIEIKIGQGAKPGEGGMLPGKKITTQVAAARHTTPFVPLLSPSNNHDLYSIEDLAQLIEEIKLVNPEALISVKCPVVPDIGVIAVGIAKAGADIINLSGYDGGTGAARKHAIEHVGLPAEVGILQAHRALVDAGIRYKVELWCDGGMKSGADAVKMILLGANRVGFASLAMIAIGCTVCRQCNKGQCRAGIATQIRTIDEAEKAGIKNFTPLDYLHAVDRLTRLFNGVGEEMRQITAQLGANCLQDLVGRADLLTQTRLHEKIDLSAMFAPVPVRERIDLEPGVGRLLTRPRNSLTRMMSELVLEIVSHEEKEITYQDEVMAFDRALGSHLAGELARNPSLGEKIDILHLRFGPSSIAGNGFASWITDKIDLLIEGGAQDGVGKGANGGRVAVMKGLNKDGQRIDGSVGKSFAYGAMRGTFIVQGNADSRACIRLSGASVVLGGEITSPIDDAKGIGTQANLKGYACEYMTSGQVVILGDPGPYAFSGMTGGVVYQMLTPMLGFDQAALQRRLARGSSVAIEPLHNGDREALRSLLGHYIKALEQTHQIEVIDHIQELCEERNLEERFVKIVPVLGEAVLQG